MGKTEHVLLAGLGADKFAADQKLDIVEASYFVTERQWDQLQKARESERTRPDNQGKPRTEAPLEFQSSEQKFGIVGTVALEQNSNLAPAPRPAD